MNPRLVVAGTVALGMAGVALVGVGTNKLIKRYRKSKSVELATEAAPESKTEPVLPEEEPVKADDALEQDVTQFDEENTRHNQTDLINDDAQIVREDVHHAD